MSREKLQEILAALVPFARSQLEELGHCPPVAAGLDGAGEIDLLLPPANVEGSTESFLDVLRTALRAGARRHEYDAVGLCAEVQAQRLDDPQPIDAICVHLEAPGESLQYFVPYTRTRDDGIDYGETFFGPAEPEIFEIDGVAPQSIP
ncbi:MAG: hypothetical protein ACC662_03205 [Planctomycetota bacterium]